MITIKTKIALKNNRDLDDISVAISNSITGFEVTELNTSHKEGDEFIVEVTGNLLHLDGFEDIQELERFL